MSEETRRHIVSDERGATSIEYAIIGAIMSIALIACMAIIGPALEDAFQRISAAFAF